MKSKRLFTNFIIAPKTQLLILTQVLSLLLLFFSVILFLGYQQWKSLIQLTLGISEVSELNRLILSSQLTNFATNTVILLLALLFFISLLLIIHTHRFLGARYAICKHITENLKKGHFDKPLILRKNDYLIPVAEAINELGDQLRINKVKSSPQNNNG